MKKKGIMICGIIMIILIFTLIIIFNTRISSTLSKNGDNLPIIDSIIEKKYISKEEGKDNNGNPYFILRYNAEDIDESDVDSFETLLVEDYGFYELNENAFEEGIQLAGRSNKIDKMWTMVIYHDFEEAYVKYTQCDNTLFNENLKEIDESNEENEHVIDEENESNMQYLDPYVQDEIVEEEPYYDPETDQYFDSYMDYQSYLFYLDPANYEPNESNIIDYEDYINELMSGEVIED